MKKINSLVVVASSQEAKIFEQTGNKKNDFRLICEIEAVLDSNHEKPGRNSNSASLRHGMEPHTDRRQVEKHDFAKKISETLTELDKENKYDGLALMASHKILEELGNVLNNQLKQKTNHKIAKDIVGFADHDIKEYLEKNLPNTTQVS